LVARIYHGIYMSRSPFPIPSVSSINDRLQGYLSLFLLCKSRVSLPSVMNHDYICTCRVLPSLRSPSRQLWYPGRRVPFQSSRQSCRLTAFLVGYHQSKMMNTPAKVIRPVVIKKIRSRWDREDEALFLCLAVAVASAGTVTVAAAAEADWTADE
jgi:hypothetical protein